jgi:MoaA/NifB/PqqE/SkfB family radical SAM enzyme
MFNFNQLKSIHLEITNRCQASCPMCSRNIHGGQVNPNLVLSDWTLEEYKKILHIDVLNQTEGIYFCGNFGDPIINNDLIEMCEYSKNINPKINLRIHTNGGARLTSWWKKLAVVMPSSHAVIFGIDGLEDTHHLYRIGTTYQNVINNAQAFISAGGRAEWVFIKFKHNEHQVEEARQRAEELGFASFTVKNSTRFVGSPKFDVRDKNNNVMYFLEPPSDNQVKFIDIETVKKVDEWTNNSVIECKALDSKEIYIDAHRNLYPCCFLASSPYYYTEPNSIINSVRNKIVDQHSTLVQDLNGMDHLNTLNFSVKDIINSDAWQTVWYEYWNQKRLITCARICGTAPEKIFSKPQDQFVERVKLND